MSRIKSALSTVIAWALVGGLIYFIVRQFAAAEPTPEERKLTGHGICAAKMQDPKRPTVKEMDDYTNCMREWNR